MPGAVLTVFEYWACDLNVSGARNAMSSYYGCTEKKKNSSQYVHKEPILLFRFPPFKVELITKPCKMNGYVLMVPFACPSYLTTTRNLLELNQCMRAALRP